MHKLGIAAGIIVITVLASFSLFAVNHTDLTFNAVPGKTQVDLPDDKGQFVQPDGKIVVWGGALAADGLAKGQIARLNTDGTVDTTFTYCGCDFIRFINAAMGLDGKIFIAGVNGPGQAKVVRLNSDGSNDPTFTSAIPVVFASTASAKIWGVQPDGKIFVEKSILAANRISYSLFRLNSDGSVDAGFTTSGGSGPIYNAMTDFALAPDGKFYYCDFFQSGGGSGGGLRRKNADGTTDATWESPVFGPSGFGANMIVDGVSLQADGNIIAAGNFDNVNGVARGNVVRLLPAGNVDLTFTAPATFFSASQPRVLQSGKILVTAVTDASNLKKFHRLNSDGSEDTFLAQQDVVMARSSKTDKLKGDSVDGGFAPPSSITSVQNRYALGSLDQIVFFGTSNEPSQTFFRLNPSGSQDDSFDPNVTDFGTVSAVARQSDGKVIVIGEYVQMNGVARQRISRVNYDGTLDTSFDAGATFSQLPNSVLIQPDGKILIGGNFAFPAPGVVRLNSNGSVDNTYTPNIGGVTGMALQNDGKLVVIGNFSTVQSTPQAGIARLNTDGSLDAGFNPIVGGNPNLTALAIHPDGKITFSGTFNGVNGFNRTGMARLNANGSLDQTFTLPAGNTPSLFWLQADGKYLLASTASLSRRNSDGSSDASFTSSTFAYPPSSQEVRINTVTFQSDGKFFVGGNFFTINNNAIIRFYLVRFNANGTFDPSYVQHDPNGEVKTVVRQPNGNIIIGGNFTAVEGNQRAGIARIVTGEVAHRPVFDFDGDGRSDLGVFRPSDGNWYLAQSTNGFSVQHFGVSGDLVTSADYDGDGKSDLAINRNGDWWYVNSGNGTLGLRTWGATGDIPLPSDFDGDGKADFIYYHPATGEWFRSGSTGLNSTVQFGMAGDVPVIADVDGDGKADPTVFRPSNGTWWYLNSTNGAVGAAQWGQSGDVPVAGDYDGDGKSDIAVWRPSNGAWYIFNSGNGSVTITGWGLAEDKPVVADYDGDGKSDIAVWRPSSGVWYILQSTAGFTGMQYGLSSDKAIPNAFTP